MIGLERLEGTLDIDEMTMDVARLNGYENIGEFLVALSERAHAEGFNNEDEFVEYVYTGIIYEF